MRLLLAALALLRTSSGIAAAQEAAAGTGLGNKLVFYGRDREHVSAGKQADPHKLKLHGGKQKRQTRRRLEYPCNKQGESCGGDTGVCECFTSATRRRTQGRRLFGPPAGRRRGGALCYCVAQAPPPAPPPPSPPVALPSCMEAPPGVSGVYNLTGGAGGTSFAVECDMVTGGGGYIKLTTDKGARNYWSLGYSTDNNINKCKYDGYSTQTNAANHALSCNGNSADCQSYNPLDFIDTTNAIHTKTVQYYSNGVQLTSDQVAYIRSVSSELHSSTSMFGGSCDDDNLAHGFTCWAESASGQQFDLTPGQGGDNQWSSTLHSSLAIEYALPTKFVLQNTPPTGGGVICGWTAAFILVK